MHQKNTQIISVILILKCLLLNGFCAVYPEQIHISIGEDPKNVIITWVTFFSTRNSFVLYGTLSKGFTSKAEGCSETFVDGSKRSVRFIHRVVLRNLKPDTFYVYRCGSDSGMSENNLFKVSPKGYNWSPRLIIFGDMGWKGAVAVPSIVKEVSDYKVNAVVHVGDIAYNLESQDGYVGDQFMKMIEPIASAIPYMTVPGNHEQAYNFSHYKRRFSMPGKSEGLFYSFNLGPAHFVALSSEAYYFKKYGVDRIITQYNWLLKDLKKAAKKENRVLRPWIIVFIHRPLYCSSDTGEDCSLEKNPIRSRFISNINYGLESVFHKFKIDIIFSGHMHFYERSFPIYNKEVFNGSCENPYKNAGAPVHIITGAAGMKCGVECASFIDPDWFPVFSCQYSYSILTVFNKSHIHLEQVSAKRGEKSILDELWLIKDNTKKDNDL